MMWRKFEEIIADQLDFRLKDAKKKLNIQAITTRIQDIQEPVVFMKEKVQRRDIRAIVKPMQDIQVPVFMQEKVQRRDIQGIAKPI